MYIFNNLVLYLGMFHYIFPITWCYILICFTISSRTWCYILMCFTISPRTWWYILTCFTISSRTWWYILICFHYLIKIRENVNEFIILRRGVVEPKSNPPPHPTPFRHHLLKQILPVPWSLSLILFPYPAQNFMKCPALPTPLRLRSTAHDPGRWSASSICSDLVRAGLALCWHQIMAC